MPFEYRRAVLYPKQRDAFYNDKRYSLCEATTKAGKTYGAMDWLLAQAFAPTSKSGQHRWWVAPVYSQAEMAYFRIKRGLIESGAIKANDSKLRIDVPNGSDIWFKSGEKPDNLYGDDVYDVVIDEASRLREESWYAVRSTLTKTQGRVRMIGNVKGRKNFFYQMARKAEAGAPDMHYSKIVAADAVAAGVLQGKEIEDAQRNLPEHVFRELYLAEPADDGGNPFGIRHIEDCIGSMSTMPARVWGIDLAKSHDWTVAIGLDATGAVCRFERWQSPWQETKTRIRALVGSARALIDSTGVGDPVLEDLQRSGGGNFEGFKFTSASKQQIMEGLAVAIQKQEIRFPDGAIKSELENFEYEYTRTGVRYSAPEGMHDDCVCALALAVHHSTFRGPGMGFLQFIDQQTKQKEIQ